MALISFVRFVSVAASLVINRFVDEFFFWFFGLLVLFVDEIFFWSFASNLYSCRLGSFSVNKD